MHGFFIEGTANGGVSIELTQRVLTRDLVPIKTNHRHPHPNHSPEEAGAIPDP